MVRKVISMSVDPGFFDCVFEKERKKFERKLGIRLSQAKFTKFLAKKKAFFKFPKQNNQFEPKEVKKIRGKKLNLNLF